MLALCGVIKIISGNEVKWTHHSCRNLVRKTLICFWILVEMLQLRRLKTTLTLILKARQLRLGLEVDLLTLHSPLRPLLLQPQLQLHPLELPHHERHLNQTGTIGSTVNTPPGLNI